MPTGSSSHPTPRSPERAKAGICCSPAVIAAVAGVLAGACQDEVPPVELVAIPADFPPMAVPEHNPLTAEGVAIGKALFYEMRLSRTGELACSSCHMQGSAFADPRQVSVGVEGRIGKHNAQALVNEGWNASFLWDGRATSLEQQVFMPLEDPLELDNTVDEVVRRLDADPVIVNSFWRAYGEGPSASTVSRALASFVRSLVSGQSRFDLYIRGAGALSEAELRGRDLFMGDRAGCSTCHAGFNFTSNEYRNNGSADPTEMGRAAISFDDADAGKYKVPTLRNIEASAPYMHDGSYVTLDDVVDHYDRGGDGHANTDPAVRPLGLAAEEKADLVAFLRTLTDQKFLSQRASWEWSR